MRSTGAIHTFRCKDASCGLQFEKFVWHKEIDGVVCPKCGKSAQLRQYRNFQAGCDYSSPVYSDAMGVNPDQVQEHRRVHPNIPITDDGRVIISSHAEGKRIRKQLGFFDRDGYSR